MNNNSNNEEKELQNQQTNNQFQQLNNTTNPRVIEIPVQHYTSPIIQPNQTNNINPDTKNQPDLDFFNRPRIFDDFQSPFDLLDSTPLRNRSLFNREPLSSRFDDFFPNRPSLSQQKPSLFDEQYLTRNGNSPSRDYLLNQPLLKERSNSTTQQPPLSNLSNYNPTTTNNNERHSPNQRTESPKQNLSGANIFQIPIQHIQTAPNSSDVPFISSDFKHQIPVKRGTDSPTPIRQTTPPSFKQPNFVETPLPPQRINTPLPFVQQQQQQQQQQPTQPQVITANSKPAAHTPLPFVQQQQQTQPQIIATNSKPAAHTSTAFINLDSDFKQPLNITSNKYRSESPARQTPIPSTVKPVNKPATDTSDFKQPVHKIRSESPVRQPAVIPLPAPVPKQEQAQQATTPQPVNPVNIRSESPVRQPTIIPLPPPPSFSKQEPQQQQAPTVPQPTMGNTLNGQSSNKKSHASNNVNTDTTDAAPAAATQQSTFYVPTVPQTAPKTAQDKCDDIACELENLHQAVNQFSGNNKKDKSYLKLDEMLTRCLLKLDDIDRTDERIHQTRRKLINFTNQLVDKLEAKVATPTASAETQPKEKEQQQQSQEEKRAITLENDNENETNNEKNSNATSNDRSSPEQLASLEIVESDQQQMKQESTTVN